MPVIHIAEATASELVALALQRRSFRNSATMEMDFIRSRLERHQIDAMFIRGPTEIHQRFDIRRARPR